MGDNVSRVIRIAALALGGSAILVALLGDRFGWGGAGGFGYTQALAGALGCGLLVLGWAGSRMPAWYRGIAIMLLNTIVLLIVAELGAVLVLKVIDRSATDPKVAGSAADQAGGTTSYRKSTTWGEAYWREFDRAYTHQYYPYQIWRMVPFEGEFIHVGSDGLRYTPGAECGPGAYAVYVFGGSTVWGMGVPDWGTVPAYLQAALPKVVQRSVCVRNFGQLGSNSTQDLIALVGELRAGRVPDFAIFLSGVNEVIMAYETGEAGVHGAIKAISQRLGRRRFNAKPEEPTVSRWLPQLNLYRLANHIVSTRRPRERVVVRFRPERNERLSDTLAQSIVRVFLANYRMVEALGREYGFEYGVFWQPNALVGRKPRTDEEQRLTAGNLGPLIELVDRRVAGVGPPEYPRLHNLVDVFAADSSLMYLDWHHLSPEGNRRVAEAMVGLLMADKQGTSRAARSLQRAKHNPGTLP